MDVNSRGAVGRTPSSVSHSIFDSSSILNPLLSCITRHLEGVLLSVVDGNCSRSGNNDSKTASSDDDAVDGLPSELEELSICERKLSIQSRPLTTADEVCGMGVRVGDCVDDAIFDDPGV